MPEDRDRMPNDGGDALTVAVLGASGFIGTYLTLNLVQMGHRVHVLSHTTDPDFVSPRGRIQTYPGAIEDEESLVGCFSGCDCVYHLVGIIAETRHKTFQATVAEGTARVVSAARRAGVRKIFYLSALGTGENSESRYYRTKWEAEQHIITSGLAYTIFRPSIVYGIGDRFINKIARMVRLSPVVPVIGDGRYRLQPVYVEELCTLMASASRRPDTDGKIYEIGGPEDLTYLEILDIIMRVLGRKRAVIHVPVSLARGMAAVLEMFLKPSPLTRDQITMLKADTTCDHTVVEREFGVRFSPLQTQLQKYLRE